MIPAPFGYQAAHSIEEAAALLAEHGDEARLLAGGQSLLPMLKLRLARPGLLVDLGPVPALRAIATHAGGLRVGAMATTCQVGRCAEVPAAYRVIPEAAADIGDPMVRNRGTFGGSLAHADPAGDWPAVALALDARVVATGPGGTREIAVDGFFGSLFTTALRPDEVLTHVELPAPPPGTGSAYVKFAHPGSGYAVAAAAAVVTMDAAGICRHARVALTGVSAVPSRATRVEATLLGQELAPDTVADAAAEAPLGLEIIEDAFAPSRYRAHLATVVTRRAITRALATTLTPAT